MTAAPEDQAELLALLIAERNQGMPRWHCPRRVALVPPRLRGLRFEEHAVIPWVPPDPRAAQHRDVLEGWPEWGDS